MVTRVPLAPKRGREVRPSSGAESGRRQPKSLTLGAFESLTVGHLGKARGHEPGSKGQQQAVCQNGRSESLPLLPESAGVAKDLLPHFEDYLFAVTVCSQFTGVLTVYSV